MYRTVKTHELILKGIPDSLRSEIWLIYSGAINEVTATAQALLFRGSYGQEKSWNFENAFSRLGIVIDFRKSGRGHGKVTEFHFLVQLF